MACFVLCWVHKAARCCYTHFGLGILLEGESLTAMSSAALRAIVAGARHADWVKGAYDSPLCLFAAVACKTSPLQGVLKALSSTEAFSEGLPTARCRHRLCAHTRAQFGLRVTAPASQCATL